MKTLVLLAHAAPSVRDRYAATLGGDIRVVPFIAPPLAGVPGGGLSSRYTTLGQRLRHSSGAPILPALLQYLGLARDDYGPIVFAWYSSGYALARQIAVAPADREAISAWIGLDGGHAPEERDGTPVDSAVRWLADLVTDTIEGRTVLGYGCSDVDPIQYASTAETIAEALKLASVRLPEIREPCPGCRIGSRATFAAGKLRIERHDHRTTPMQEHSAALTEWGADFAARVLMLLDPTDAPTQPDLPSPARTAGEMALQAALVELEAGAREVGNNGGATVARYFAGCVRGGKPLGISSGSWCAAFAGWCDDHAKRALVAVGAAPTVPCLWRGAVWELIEDARRSGAWREAGEYVPVPGDLAVFRRAGYDPRTPPGLGHVGRVETAPDDSGRYTTIDGNSGAASDRVARVERTVGDMDLCGWIAYGKEE